MRTSNALLAFLRHAHSCLLQQAGEFTEEKWIQKPDEHIDAAAASSRVYSSRLPVSARQTSADLSRSLLHLRDPASIGACPAAVRSSQRNRRNIWLSGVRLRTAGSPMVCGRVWSASVRDGDVVVVV